MKIKAVTAIFLLFTLLICFCGCKKKEQKPKSQQTSVSVSDNGSQLADDNITEETHDFSFLFGTWRLIQGEGLYSYVFDDKGSWVSYTAEGEIYHKGTLKAHLEYENLYKYDLYADNGDLCFSFYMDSETTFHIGNEGETVYQKITR